MTTSFSWRRTLQQGLLVGLKSAWTLSKVIFPITLIVNILQFTPLFRFVMDAIRPLLSFIGLSGEAAIPLVLGNLLNLYAGIGGILSLDLSVKEVFILAVMLSFSHNLLVESSVAARVGVKLPLMIAVRIGLALVSAFLIHHAWDGGRELAQYGFMAKAQLPASGDWFGIVKLGFMKAFTGIWQMTVIIVPFMVIIQIMKDKQWLPLITRTMGPFMRLLNIDEKASLTMAAGLLFGLAYGAGVMIQAAEEDGVSKRDLTLCFIFLVGCHAVVEDTLVFVPLGIPVWPLLAIRLVAAFSLTLLIAYVWRKPKLERVSA